MDVDRLKKIAGAVRTGGKGTVRRHDPFCVPNMYHSTSHLRNIFFTGCLYSNLCRF
jgi:hypothetical protein